MLLSYSYFSFRIDSINSAASAILGPGACINNTGSSSATFPVVTAVNLLNPGIIGNMPDNFGAGSGAGDIVKINPGLLVAAFSAVRVAARVKVVL